MTAKRSLTKSRKPAWVNLARKLQRELAKDSLATRATVNQACTGTLALKEALILQSSQLPLLNHVFYTFCDSSNEGVNLKRKSWGSLRFCFCFFALFAPPALSWQPRLWLVPRGFFILPRVFGNKNFAKFWGMQSVSLGTVEMVN